MTIARYLSRIASQYPDRCALIYGEERWTYREYESKANRLARALAGTGVKEGDRVAVYHTNCPEHCLSLFAAAKLGAIYCPLNCRLRDKELAQVLKDCEPAVVLAGKRYAEHLARAVAETETTGLALIVDAPSGEPHSLCDFVAGAGGSAPEVEVSEDASALLLYTSGTTGVPKGVLHSHASLVQRCEARRTVMDDPSLEKVCLLAVPVFHITGVQVVIKTAASGGTAVIMPQFRVEEALRAIESERVMMAVVVPTMLEQLVTHPDLDQFDLESLRLIVYGGSPISPDLIRQAMRSLPCMFVQGYGLTEAGVTWLQPEEHLLEPCPGERDRLESVGRAIPGVEIAIVSDAGEHLRPGETGEIIVRGAGVMLGYWGLAEETARSIRNGWFYTGDMGFLDGEGFLFVTGRKKEIIIRGGENIAPLEVESVLTAHPAVAEAAVFGIPHPRWGEIVGAAVVLKEDEELAAEELIDFCRQRIASFKKPERIFFVRSLPRNAAGKVMKSELKKAYGGP